MKDGDKISNRAVIPVSIRLEPPQVKARNTFVVPPHLPPSSEKAENWVSFYWLVRTADDDDDANTTQSEISVRVLTKSSSPSMCGGCVLQNSVDIKKGDELLIFKPEEETVQEEVEAVEPSAKKAKKEKKHDKSDEHDKKDGKVKCL